MRAVTLNYLSTSSGTDQGSVLIMATLQLTQLQSLKVGLSLSIQGDAVQPYREPIYEG